MDYDAIVFQWFLQMTAKSPKDLMALGAAGDVPMLQDIWKCRSNKKQTECDEYELHQALLRFAHDLGKKLHAFAKEGQSGGADEVYFRDDKNTILGDDRSISWFIKQNENDYKTLHFYPKTNPPSTLAEWFKLIPQDDASTSATIVLVMTFGFMLIVLVIVQYCVIVKLRRLARRVQHDGTTQRASPNAVAHMESVVVIHDETTNEIQLGIRRNGNDTVRVSMSDSVISITIPNDQVQDGGAAKRPKPKPKRVRPKSKK